MKKDIKKIWIESEDKGAILKGEIETNDNSDVIVTMIDNTRYIATFFTYKNLEHIRQKNKKSGECLSGKYFWASDMIIIEKINRMEVEEVVDELISKNEFEQVFDKIEK